MLVCPARPGKVDQWAIVTFGEPEIVSSVAVQRRLDAFVETSYPLWQHRGSWHAVVLLVRHRIDAETAGFIEPRKPTPDDVVNLVADDPAVRAAVTPGDLVRHG
jgi:hypothetical protein